MSQKADCTAAAFKGDEGEEYTLGSNEIILQVSDNGKYLCFRAEDKVGNIGYATSEVLSGLQAPAIDLDDASDTGVSDSDSLTNNNTPTITVSGFNSNHTVTVTASKSGSEDVTATRTGSGDVKLGELAEGTWEIVASEGTNTYPETETLTVTVDTTDPSFSLSTITPYNWVGVPNGRSYRFTATVTDTNLGGVNKGVMMIIESTADCDADIDFTETTHREYTYSVEHTISYSFTPADDLSFCFRTTDAAGNASFLKKDIPVLE